MRKDVQNFIDRVFTRNFRFLDVNLKCADLENITLLYVHKELCFNGESKRRGFYFLPNYNSKSKVGEYLVSNWKRKKKQIKRMYVKILKKHKCRDLRFCKINPKYCENALAAMREVDSELGKMYKQHLAETNLNKVNEDFV